jgi:hypothetical protein
MTIHFANFWMYTIINSSIINFLEARKIHLTKTKMSTTLTLFDRMNTKNKVAHITYYTNTDDSEVFIGYLDVMPAFQGRGFGKMMIVLMLADLMRDAGGMHVKYIRLDDCSDFALQKRSLYFKLGFRIANARSAPETMTVFIGSRQGNSRQGNGNVREYYTYENGTKPVSNVYKNVGEFVESIVGSYAMDKGRVTWAEFGDKYVLKKEKSVDNRVVNDEQDDLLAELLGKLSDVKLIRYAPRNCARDSDA